MHAIAIDSPFAPIHRRTQSASRATVNAAERLRDFQRTQARIAAVLLSGTLPSLLLVSRDMDKMIDVLNSVVMDRATEADLKTVAHDIGQLVGKVGKVLKGYESIGLRDMPIYRAILDRVDGRREHLSSIVEGMHLSLDKDFVDMIGKAAGELSAECTGTERRSRCQPVA